jgi:hypothetical protein
MKSAVNSLGSIFMFLFLFWVIGESVGNPPTFAAAVGQGVKATISFFAGVAHSI